MIKGPGRPFGVHNLAFVEDVVQDAFCRALEAWSFRGVPENPSAWLMSVAKNRTLDILRREKTATTYEPELSRFLQSEWTLASAVDERFTDDAIHDDQLRMMFSCCHPRLSEEAQVMLILNILCGFGIDEVASAFVTTYTAVEKRIPRAKKVLAESKKLFDTRVPADYSARLPAVQRTLYLLFNEGYHGASAELTVRAELCQEAMRLAALLLKHPLGATPRSYAFEECFGYSNHSTPHRGRVTGKPEAITWTHNR
jgi:RNA polymerase sigma factor (sigma-70 family)